MKLTTLVAAITLAIAPLTGFCGGPEGTALADDILIGGPGVTEFSMFEPIEEYVERQRIIDQLRAMPKIKVSAQYVLVVDVETGIAIYQKNIDDIVPIASITKLMTAIVVLDQEYDLDELVTITNEDVKWLKVTKSKLKVGTTLPRGEMLRLALMSSDNRAAVSLARTSPGGVKGFVSLMNDKAAELGMDSTHFEDPTGLTPENVSTARDLIKMIEAAAEYRTIREFSTTQKYKVSVGIKKTGKKPGRPIVAKYSNSNALIHGNKRNITISKTGYIKDAGRCLVMEADVAARAMYIVLLDSRNKLTRVRDAIALMNSFETPKSKKQY